MGNEKNAHAGGQATAGATGGLETRIHLTAVARGEAPADRFIRGGTLVNVYSGELLPAHLALARGHIAYVGTEERAIGPETEVIQAAGRYLTPGWIEPHCHPWILYNPVSLVEGVLPGGTTRIFNDNLFFHLLAGPDGFKGIMEALAALPLRYHWLLRIVPPSEWPRQRDFFSLEKMTELLGREEVAGTAEVTRWPLVFQGDRYILEVLERARRAGKRSDGHTAGASYEKLNAVVAAGISACHEAITAGEALDRLRLGLWTVLRHSSVRPDLPELMEAITRRGVDTRRLMLTVDGPAPRFIAEDGFIDEALRLAVAAGVPPVQAIQMATLNPATFFGMDQQVGGIAPGRQADILILPDLERFRPDRVLVAGRDVAHEGSLSVELPDLDWDALGMRPRFAPRLEAFLNDGGLAPRAGGSMPVIRFVSNVITETGGQQSWAPDGSIPSDFLLGVLIDREGEWVTRAWIQGLAPGLTALASTFNTSTHLLVLGREPRAMKEAAAWVIRKRGGLSFADSARVSWALELPVAGAMSNRSFGEVVEAQREIDARLRAAGFPYRDTLYSLLFLTCDFLPGLRLTPRGVLDVKRDEVLESPERC